MTIYQTIRKIHLYASLPIVALLLMYVVSSYFMIHYEYFDTYDRQETVRKLNVTPEEVAEPNWPDFLISQGVTGKLTDEDQSPNGELIREYSRAGKRHIVTLSAGETQVEIKSSTGNLAGMVVGLHRIRGFEGPWPYKLYAAMLDLVGVSLVIFAITGAFLWLKLLKNDPIAWCIFIAGFLYVSAVMAYLMLV